jgi:hypothetical protein
MLNISKIGLNNFKEFPTWPPVHAYSEHDASMIVPLLKTTSLELRERLATSRINYYQHANFLFQALGVLYAHFYGYVDAPSIEKIEDIESHIVRIKRILEDEMVNHIFKPDLSRIDQYTHSTQATVDYLQILSKNNPGVDHVFFDYVKDRMTPDDMKKFLWFETMRNEVVDDEVAMLVPGTQHAMKQVLSSNLWDECGNGKIDGFHTSWLIRLLSNKNQWPEFLEFRKSRPWYSMATSHSFNSLLTTPGRNFAAYGTFLINESWVIPHFIKILAGMDRLNIEDADVRIYFEAHCNIDDHHSAELIEGIMKQSPELKQSQRRDVLVGAHQAIASANVMYANMLSYFQNPIKVQAR